MPGPIRFLNDCVVQHRLHILPEFSQVFMPQFSLFCCFFRCQYTGLFSACKFVYSLDFLSFHLYHLLPDQDIRISVLNQRRKLMVQGKWFAPGTDLSVLLPVRESVFGRGADNLDASSWNALVFEDSVPVATGRIWWENGSYWLGDIAVLKEYRRRRFGDLVLRLLLFKAQSHAAREVRLHCPQDLTGFFDRLGFIPLPSDEPDKVEMAIPGDAIDLDTCKNCPRISCPGRK